MYDIYIYTFKISFSNLQFLLRFRLVAMIYTLIFIVLLAMCAPPSAGKNNNLCIHLFFFEFVTLAFKCYVCNVWMDVTITRTSKMNCF